MALESLETWNPMRPFDVARMLQLIDEGGWVVSSARCTPQEIAWARAEERFFVSSDGMGYVVRPAASLPTPSKEGT